ncbi:MAG TPA: MarR family transcriptional regulator [Candidatus Pullilachnospira gallistercoris]|uniref:MarR family transcriptional regulator n=1 Tax=Candidatus Pullilachnospira gallistercoris TaxID=2840911 RepID=A0A9D1E991_9FIRM|nr:MarR family transcriptional regulator [Candidatus Pullilachnospira gallistercoris]
MKGTTEWFTGLQNLFRLYDKLLKKVCMKYDLSLIEADVISFLRNNPQKDTAADIVELRMLSKGAVSKAVEVLVQRSLLERIPDGKDRRKIHLRLKPEANPITENIDEVREEFLDTILEGFSKEEVEMQVSLNQRLFENTMRAMEGREKS